MSRLTPSGKVRPLTFLERTLLYLFGIICLAAIIVTLLVWKSRSTPQLEWADLGNLPTIEDHALGVSSEVSPDDPAYIEPLLCRGHANYALEKIEEILSTDKAFLNVRRNETQLQAIAISPWLGLQDDILFQARTDPERLEIYAASRAGPMDLGANRKRIEELRELLRQLHVVK
ncbi:DUF1499 domain-containing protein [Cerasicoccus arenae]